MVQTIPNQTAKVSKTSCRQFMVMLG